MCKFPECKCSCENNGRHECPATMIEIRRLQIILDKAYAAEQKKKA